MTELLADAQKEAVMGDSVAKLNLLLVRVLVNEWPHNWPSFISEIVSASRGDERLCENNMRILRLLSEEVFDFSKEEMTAL